MSHRRRHTKFAAWLRAAMAREELICRDIAEGLGVVTEEVYAWRAGERYPTRRHLELLAAGFRVRPAQIPRRGEELEE